MLDALGAPGTVEHFKAMCTVSWLEKSEGYDLFFNRDERLSRSRAELPKVKVRGGRRMIMPIDPDSGGTWLTVNEYGLTIALLNFYEAMGAPESEDRPYTSRGLLVCELAEQANREGAKEQISDQDLNPYRPFTLLLVDPAQPVREALRWDGEMLTTLQLDLPLLTSSSYDAEGAERARRELWTREEKWKSARLRDLHRSHEPERGPYSPCMHRSDATTVSFSWIRVKSKKISFIYSDGPPCKAILEPPVKIKRR